MDRKWEMFGEYGRGSEYDQSIFYEILQELINFLTSTLIWSSETNLIIVLSRADVVVKML